jgi:hypothetical protein
MKLEKIKINIENYLIKDVTRVPHSQSVRPQLRFGKRGGGYLSQAFTQEFKNKHTPAKDKEAPVFFQVALVGNAFYLLLSRINRSGFVSTYRGMAISFPSVLRDLLKIKK